MNLPQELLDEILLHLPSDEGRSLRSCSLVSKSWLEPSRRLLFKHIRIRQDNYKLWLATISPTNAGVLFHVHSFAYFLRVKRTSDSRSVYIFRDYFPSFCQLKKLTLCHLDIEPTIPEHLHLFSAFHHTLSSLSLGVVSISWRAFVALVGYFPNLRNLNLLATSFRMDDIRVPDISHPGRGKLFIDRITSAAADFPFDRFTELRPEYEELQILGAYEHRLVAAVERTLKSLKVNLCDPNPAPGLSRCPELRQLTIAVVHPGENERNLISSITSITFQTLVLVAHPAIQNSDLRKPCWIDFDDMICGLVDRLQSSGYKNTLEVELRGDKVSTGGEVSHGEFLPKFKKKGRVRIVRNVSGIASEGSNPACFVQ